MSGYEFERREPTTRDGRNVSSELGELVGEGASIEVKKEPGREYPSATRPLPITPSAASAGLAPTYYDLPVLKEPVWIATIPTYFFVGGISGATSCLGAVVEIAAPRRLGRLARATRLVGVVGDLASAALLVADLGRPARFLNMLRVFRPTSPMSVGSWVLALSGAANTAGLVLSEAPAPLSFVGRAASVASGALGIPLAGYTAVLISGTAVPFWQTARRSLPVLFIASSAATAGALLELLP
ncbi:MAG TPA: NrfD/PsrC family molybdoenzyme membrane anchor subunit, partial [Minicystis sp.]|nr:NrfD/PsrC family molybdoenzyme membrane anchor subunit [Minicystis sp.]